MDELECHDGYGGYEPPTQNEIAEKVNEIVRWINSKEA